MAQEIPVTLARAQLSELVNQVGYGGERVVLTKHGRALAVLVPAAEFERFERWAAGEGSAGADASVAQQGSERLQLIETSSAPPYGIAASSGGGGAPGGAAPPAPGSGY